MASANSALALRIGAAVRRLREGVGWSQAELAERIETSVEYVSMLERGTRIPSVPTLVRLGRALDATLDVLTGAREATRSDDDALVALARAVPAGMRRAATLMLRGVAETETRYGRRGRRAARATTRFARFSGVCALLGTT